MSHDDDLDTWICPPLVELFVCGRGGVDLDLAILEACCFEVFGPGDECEPWSRDQHFLALSLFLM